MEKLWGPAFFVSCFHFNLIFPGRNRRHPAHAYSLFSERTESAMSNSMLGSLAGRRQGLGSTVRRCAYARQLLDPLTSAREKLRSSRELLQKCSQEVGLFQWWIVWERDWNTSLCMHFALCTGLYVRTVCLLKSQPQTVRLPEGVWSTEKMHAEISNIV